MFEGVCIFIIYIMIRITKGYYKKNSKQSDISHDSNLIVVRIMAIIEIFRVSLSCKRGCMEV